MGFGDFLKELRDAAVVVPIVGGWVQNIGPHDKEGTHASHAAETIFRTPVEKVMHGMAWAYDNGISQPLSTAILMGSREKEESFGHLFSANDWSTAWRAANHISPGQAWTARFAGMQPGDVTSMHSVGTAPANKLINSPLVYAQPAPAYLPPNWKDLSEDEQQALLKKGGMPAVGNEAVEQLRRDSSFFSFASGATDFAARWWLDPTIIGGKAVGAARAKHVVSARPKGGWSGEDINKIMASSRMAKAQAFLWENKDNPQVINNLDMFKKSALGPRAGGIISKLQSPEEVNLFLRTSLGDVEARAQLQTENAAAATRMEQDTSRLSNLEVHALPRVQAQANPAAEAMVTKRMDELSTRIAADEDLAARYDAAVGHYGELDALNLTGRSAERARLRTEAQNAFRTGPALGTAGSRRSALGKTRIYANDLFGDSLTMVRSFKEAHPNGMLAIDDLHHEAIDELRAQVARIPGIGPDIRGDLLNRYLKTTTEGERLDLLDEIESLGVTQVAKKHGFTHDEGMALYQEYRANITHGQEALRTYSGANFGGERRAVDIFNADGMGTKLRPHPNMVTKLANDHILIDLPALNKVLARNASSLKALRTSRVGNPDWIIDGLDGISHLWKFATLFRLGYVPRVLGDDLLGQSARLGAATMAARIGYGTKNLATNLFHWKPAAHYEGAEAVAREGVKYADEEIKVLTPQADALRAKLAEREAVHKTDLTRAKTRAARAQAKLDAMDPADTVKTAAMQQLVGKLNAQASAAERRLASHSPGHRDQLAQLDEQMSELAAHRELQLTAAESAKAVRKQGFRQSSQLHNEPEVGGIKLPAAFAGERGEYYYKATGSDDSLRTLLKTNKQMIHSNLVRSASNVKAAAVISYPGTEKLFVEAWHKAINHQIMQDDLAVQAVNGASIDDMANWLAKTPKGRAYRKRLGIKYDTNDRIAASVWHEVDEYMPEFSGVREAALKGEADVDYLTNLAKTGQYPQYVHSSQLGEALAGSNAATRTMDRVIDGFYKWAASLPADRMSRHPLFNQLYEGHAKTLVNQELKQGVKVTQKDADSIAETARRLALKDTRKLVFDIAHRTDVAAALRFMSPFYAATTEAWQRWARIIADRPQTVGYASVFFNAPISWGWMQDQDGNVVQRDGTAMVWDAAANRLMPRFVPKSERRIMARVPKFIAAGPIGKAMGMDSSGNWSVSQDSMNLITQGDPWFNPGTGPIVSIPASLLVKDKPKQAELMRKLGVLPFGPTPGGVGRTLYEQGMPTNVRNFLTAYDTSDERYQRIKLQIMQQAAYEHANLGKPMLSAQEIADRTKSYWLWSAVSAFTQPFATQKPDKYQFYRDQYNNLLRKDQRTADEQFLQRFPDYFVFAQSVTKNVGGAPPTQRAVELSQKYGNLIAKNPELAALIIGPEGDGPFSPEAYTYQLTTPLTPGGAEAQRTRMSADEAMAENQRRLGWAKYTRMSNYVTSELHKAGFESFQEQGAERFKQMRSAIATLYGDPLLPDGSDNPYYNEHWSKDFYSLDPKRYDRMIPGLSAVANSELANQPNRTDLVKLQQYLRFRRMVNQELASRDAAGGSKVLAAKSNSDLAGAWGRIVDGLIESDTRFGDLWSRYLSRDMGVDLTDVSGLGIDEEVA